MESSLWSVSTTLYGWISGDSGADPRAVRLALVTVSHLIPIAMTCELVREYINADLVAQPNAGGHCEQLRRYALVTNGAGNFLNLASWFRCTRWQFSLRVVSWRDGIGWLGLLVGVLAGG